MGRQVGLLRLAVSSARATDWNLRPPPSVVLLGGPMRPHAGAVFFDTRGCLPSPRAAIARAVRYCLRPAVAVG
jgi:hypothetical protein